MIWRFFPGPAVVRIIAMVAVLAAIVYVLMFYGYPWAATFIEADPISTVGE